MCALNKYRVKRNYFKIVEDTYGDFYSNLSDKVRWEMKELYLRKEE